MTSLCGVAKHAGARHMSYQCGRSPFYSSVRSRCGKQVGWEIPCVEGLGLPTLQGIREVLGHVELLMIPVYRALVEGKIKCKDFVRKFEATIRPQMVKTLHVGLVRWQQDMLMNNRAYTADGVRYIRLNRLRKANTEWLGALGYPLPCAHYPLPQFGPSEDQLFERATRMVDGILIAESKKYPLGADLSQRVARGWSAPQGVGGGSVGGDGAASSAAAASSSAAPSASGAAADVVGQPVVKRGKLQIKNSELYPLGFPQSLAQKVAEPLLKLDGTLVPGERTWGWYAVVELELKPRSARVVEELQGDPVLVCLIQVLGDVLGELEAWVMSGQQVASTARLDDLAERSAEMLRRLNQ